MEVFFVLAFNIMLPFISGLYFYNYGEKKNWSFARILGVSMLVSCIFSILGTTLSSCLAAEVNPYQRLKETTVKISIGTGFILEAPSGKKYLMTNAHVCNRGNWLGKMRANYEDGSLVQGSIVKSDFKPDLCAVEVEKSRDGLKISKSLDKKETLYTRGYPLDVLSQTSGNFLYRRSWKYTFPIEEIGECFDFGKKEKSGEGITVGCSVVYRDNITNMYSRPGSSGSPVVNSKSELVGVMSSWDSGKDAGGMVTLEDIKEFVKGL